MPVLGSRAGQPIKHSSGRAIHRRGALGITTHGGGRYRESLCASALSNLRRYLNQPNGHTLLSISSVLLLNTSSPRLHGTILLVAHDPIRLRSRLRTPGQCRFGKLVVSRLQVGQILVPPLLVPQLNPIAHAH